MSEWFGATAVALGMLGCLAAPAHSKAQATPEAADLTITAGSFTHDPVWVSKETALDFSITATPKTPQGEKQPSAVTHQKYTVKANDGKSGSIKKVEAGDLQFTINGSTATYDGASTTVPATITVTASFSTTGDNTVSLNGAVTYSDGSKPTDNDSGTVKAVKCTFSPTPLNIASGAVGTLTATVDNAKNKGDVSFTIQDAAGWSGGVASLTSSTAPNLTVHGDGVGVAEVTASLGGVEGPKVTVNVIAVTLTSDPLSISATTVWGGQEKATTTSNIRIETTPPGFESQIALDIQASSPQVANYGNVTSVNATKWTYSSFGESRSELHPTATNITIRAKVLGDAAGSTLVLVSPVFYWLTAPHVLHQHGPGATPHVPSASDYQTAFDFLQWKYSKMLNNVSYGTTVAAGFLGRFFYPSAPLNPFGKPGSTVLRFGFFAQDFFSGENFCASQIGHELIHTGQVEPGSNVSECEAYSWQLAHAVEAGLSQSEIATVTNQKKPFCNSQ